MGSGTITRESLEQLFKEEDLELRPDIELATSDLIVPIVKNGLGIGFVPEPFAREALEKGEVFRVRLNKRLAQRNICLICRADGALSIAAEAFRKLCTGG